MGDELLKEVKIRLRSLVVSSPTQMDSRTLMRDYVKLLGTHIPLAKMGYKDFVTFLRERCSDSFLLSGPSSNPILTVIVPDSTKHIDNMVQRSKLPSTAKVRTKRRSIQEARVNPPKQDLIYNSFVKHQSSVTVEPKNVKVSAPDNITNHTKQIKENVDHHKNTTVTSNDVKNFLKKRLPLYNSFSNLEEALSEIDGTLSQSQDSGKHTSSSSSSTKALQLEKLKSEIKELICDAPEGVWCTDLIRLYRERYNRELNFTRFGYMSIVSLACALDVHVAQPARAGDLLLSARAPPAPAAPAPAPRLSRARPAPPAHSPLAPDPDDALPGIEFDADVFPADCVGALEPVAALSLADVRPGAMLEVLVGEVYSPSHFWLIRLGDNYNIAMEDIMDEMNAYYNGSGRERVLARGAVRVGQHCAALYDNDWHRAVIVKILDSDTVKVRHVDYGTVDTVRAAGLRPLCRRWAALGAQAVRARLAGVRPPAAGRRWPAAAAAAFLERVRQRRLVANVVAVHEAARTIETLLIDTGGARDVCLSAALVRAGHADARPDSALRAAECYLYPRFEALEGGDTPNLAEIHAYLRDGIALDYVEAYRRHVPACLPPSPPSPASPASPPDEDSALHELYASPPPSPLPPPPPPPPRPASPPAAAASSPAVTSLVPESEQASKKVPALSVVPPVRRQAAINPEAQVFVPRQGCPAPGPQWFGPHSGGVTLSLAECDTYRMLARVNPAAAHFFMASALGRAMAAPMHMGPDGMGPAGMGPTGMGPTGMGPTGMGPTGMGPTGMGPTGMRPTGMGPPGMGPPGMSPPCMGPPGMGHIRPPPGY